MEIEHLLTYFKGQFPFLSEEEINSVIAQVQIRVLQKDEYLFQEGETRKTLGFILKGIVRIFFLKDGNDITCEFRMENMVVGNFESILLGLPSSRYFAPTEETMLATINYDELNKLLAKSNKLEQARILMLQQNLGESITKSDNYILYNPEQRYLHLLETNPSLPQRVPLKYIASYLGITPVSLSRIRKRIQ